MEATYSKVEKSFLKLAGNYSMSTQIPYIIVENFPKLGLLTALRFLEWVSENPEGVISLPTGKTPEYFIKFTQYLLKNWNRKKGEEIRKSHGLDNVSKPDLGGLHFVQIDEFYPISPEQHNSFCNYVDQYYIKGLGIITIGVILYSFVLKDQVARESYEKEKFRILYETISDTSSLNQIIIELVDEKTVLEQQVAIKDSIINNFTSIKQS